MNRDRWYFVLWTGVILMLVVPWFTFRNHPHWSRVAWIPFVSAEVKVRDVAANVLLYAPWGYFWARQRADSTQRVGLVVVLAAGLSTVTELSQVYTHSRFPSATDVTCNLIGAFAGAHYARKHSRSKKQTDIIGEW